MSHQSHKDEVVVKVETQTLHLSRQEARSDCDGRQDHAKDGGQDDLVSDTGGRHCRFFTVKG